MIRGLISDDPRFKALTFRAGLNILMADRSDDAASTTSAAGERRTRNGAGKSSVIDLVHFLLAGRPEGALKSDALASWGFTGEFRGALDRPLSIDRSLANASVVQRRSGEKAGQLSTAALAQEVGEEWFRLGEKQGPGGPSFRQLMPYFARRRRDGGYDHPVRSSRSQTPAASEVNLAHLFGLDSELVRRLHVARAALKQVDGARKVLRDLDKAASGTTRADLEAQLSARIAAASLARDSLKAKIEAFNVLPAFRELERELSELHQLARDLSVADVLDREVIELNTRALGSELPTTPPDLETLFEEAKVVFPDLVARRYDEVARFHAQLVENRREHLESEIGSARRRIEARTTARENVEDRRRTITASLRVSGPAEELLALSHP